MAIEIKYVKKIEMSAPSNEKFLSYKKRVERLKAERKDLLEEKANKKTILARPFSFNPFLKEETSFVRLLGKMEKEVMGDKFSFEDIAKYLSKEGISPNQIYFSKDGFDVSVQINSPTFCEAAQRERHSSNIENAKERIKVIDDNLHVIAERLLEVAPAEMSISIHASESNIQFLAARGIEAKGIVYKDGSVLLVLDKETTSIELLDFGVHIDVLCRGL